MFSGSGLALREHPGFVGPAGAVKRAFYTAVVKMADTGVSKTLCTPHGLASSGVVRVRVPSAASFFENEGEYMARGVYVIALSFWKEV